MMEKPPRCQVCGRVIESQGPVGRRDACPGCDADLHACRQCQFHDAYASNQCRDPQAERIANKDQANFCDYFRLSRAEGAGANASAAEEAKRKLDDLFRK